MSLLSGKMPAFSVGAPLLACATRQYNNDYGHVRVFDPVAGGETLVVIDVGSSVNALAFFREGLGGISHGKFLMCV